MKYENPGTVVVSLVAVNSGLLLVRRALADGQGKLALPGGYQCLGETWQQAGAREVKEETGLAVDPDRYMISEVITVEEGKINLIFAYQMRPYATTERLAGDAETMEVVIVDHPVTAAFETHTRQIKRFFRSFREVMSQRQPR